MRRVIGDYSRNRKQRAQLLNVLHSQFLHQGLTTIVKKDIATAQRRAKAIELLSAEGREEAQWVAQHLELYEKRLEQLKERIEREAEENTEARRLKTIDGVGPIVALAYVAYVGDGKRFGSASQVSNYLGLVPRVDISGTIVRYGNITKRGNTYLRSLLVQAGWALVRSKKEGALKNRYLYMTQEKGLSKKKSIVAVARKLAELMFTLLRTESDYEIRPFKRALGKEVVRQAVNT
jgi:transposase